MKLDCLRLLEIDREAFRIYTPEAGTHFTAAVKDSLLSL